MRDSTINRIIDETKAIYRALVWWTLILVVGIFAMIRPGTVEDERLFVASLAAVIVAMVAISLNVLRVRGLEALDVARRPPGPLDDPSDVLLMPTEQPIREMALVRTDTPGQTLKSIYSFTAKEWRQLYMALKRNDWHWRRKPLREARIFYVESVGVSSSTTAGYNEISAEFIRLNIIEREPDNPQYYRVSEFGMDVLEEWARVEVRT